MAPPGYVSPVPPPAVEPVVGAPAYYAPPAAQRTSRTADVAITCVLLALGVIGMLIGVSTGLTLDRSLAGQAATYGVTYHAPADLGALGAVIVISHVVLYLAALGVSIALLVKRRTSFWVPLVGGVVAAIIFWGILLSLIMSDQALMNALQNGSH
jgi:hypothetical protein